MKVDKLDFALERMFETVQVSSKDESKILIVCLGEFVYEKWEVIYSKLSSSKEILTKVNSLSFDCSLLSLNNLKDLHYLFLQHQDTFPYISIKETPAKRDLQDFKGLFPDRKVPKFKQFLRRIMIKHIEPKLIKNSSNQSLYINCTLEEY